MGFLKTCQPRGQVRPEKIDPRRGDCELMAQEQVLGFKPAPRLERSTMNIPSECRPMLAVLR
jgi:hypothetical protein